MKTATFFFHVIGCFIGVMIGSMIAKAIFPSDCERLEDKFKTEMLKVEALQEAVENINVELDVIRGNLKTEAGKTDATLELMRQYRKINQLEEQLKMIEP